jgi:hypothetical protein
LCQKKSECRLIDQHQYVAIANLKFLYGNNEADKGKCKVVRQKNRYLEQGVAHQMSCFTAVAVKNKKSLRGANRAGLIVCGGDYLRRRAAPRPSKARPNRAMGVY